MSYPNLSEATIEHSTAFFNQVDSNNDGLVSIGEIYQVCYDYASQNPSYTPAAPAFMPNIFLMENKTAESLFTQAEYLSLQASYPLLTDDFSVIDSDSNGSVLGSELITHYEPQPQMSPIIPTSSFWLEHIKEQEDLTDASEISLEQFLTFENSYNFTRYWPVTQ